MAMRLVTLRLPMQPIKRTKLRKTDEAHTTSAACVNSVSNRRTWAESLLRMGEKFAAELPLPVVVIQFEHTRIIILTAEWSKLFYDNSQNRPARVNLGEWPEAASRAHMEIWLWERNGSPPVLNL
jgi:hypothetical protein